MAMTVAPGVTVRSIADRQASAVAIDEIVAGAEQIGSPRWVESDVVQVKLQVPASAVLDQLSKGNESTRDPRVTPGVIKRLQREWAGRQVQASGQAVPADRIAAAVAASPSATWTDVPPERRVDVARRAQASAARTVVTTGAAIRVGPNETLGQAWDAKTDATLNDWAMTLPATRVLLRDDRQVEVGLFVDKPAYEGRLLDTVQPAGQPDNMRTEAMAKAVAAGVAAMPQVIVGRAAADEVASPPRLALGGEFQPAWANRLLTAEATAKGGPERLRTARQAEIAAAASLRTAVENLPLDPQRTIGQAAKADPGVDAAVDRALTRARPYQVDYHADGSVTLRLALEAGEVVDALSH
jgi:hypothetical protein